MKKKFKINNEELFLKAQQGDESAREELLVANDRLCYYIAQRYESTKIPRDDLASMCRIGLIKAYNSFKPDKKVKFATYATRIMHNEILIYLRRTKKFKNNISINQPLNVDSDGNELTVEDIYAAPEPDYTFDDYETAKKVIKIFNANAKEKYKQVFQLRIIEGKTQLETGEILEISQSYVARMTMAVKEMLQYIAKTGNYKYITANKKSNKFKKPGVEEMKITKASMKYIFENYTTLKVAEVAKLTGYSQQSIHNYKSKYKKDEWAEVNSKIDPSLKAKIDKYIVENKTEKVKKPESIRIPSEYEAVLETRKEKLGVYVETSNTPSPEIPNYIHFNPELKAPASEAAIAFAFTGKAPEEIGKEAAQKAMEKVMKTTDKKEELKKEKNIIIKNEIALMSNNRDEISDLIYGIYQMIKNSPAGEVKIEMKYEVRV